MSADAGRVRLTVIGYPKSLDLELEGAALSAHGDQPFAPIRFARAQYNHQVVHEVVNVTRGLETVDLVGHGRPGELTVGDELLVSTDPGTWGPLLEVAGNVAAGGAIRLLGCITASTPGSQQFIRELAERLQVTVVGTTAPIYPSDFGPQGISQTFIDTRTFSSAQRAPAAYVPPGGDPGFQLAEGYLFDRAGVPIAAVERREKVKEGAVHSACGGRVLWVTRPDRPPATCLWTAEGPPPPLGEVVKALDGS